MEQNRAPAIFVHHHELACQAAGQLPGYYRLISATTTKTGLKVVCELDDKLYPKGVVVSDEELAAVNIVRADFHGEWNYTIKPSHRSDSAVDS